MNTEAASQVAWATPASTVWVCDRSQVMVVNQASGAAWRLTGEQMPVWNWINLGHSYPTLVEMFALLLDQTPAQVGSRLQAMLQEWQRSGLLEKSEVEHG